MVIQVVVRSAEEGDFEGWSRVYCDPYDDPGADYTDTYDLTDGRIQRPPVQQQKDWWREMQGQYKKGRAVLVVAEKKEGEDKEIVGWCFIVPVNRFESEISHNGILGIRVARKYARQGVGKKLLKVALERADSVFERIKLEALATVPTMGKPNLIIGLYERFGFKQYGRAHRAVKRGNEYIDIAVMERLRSEKSRKE